MLAAETLLLDSLRLTDAKLEARLTDGLLELTRFTADSYGGALSVTGRADARDPSAGLQLAADLTASEVDVKGLLRDFAGIDRFSGPVTLESRLNTRGTSQAALVRSEEHTSELQSLMRISYAVFCLKKKKTDLAK